MITVAVIDDHPATRLGLVETLKGTPDIKVIGEAGSGTELAALLEKHAPDVLLLDISMPQFDIFEAIPLMRKKLPQMRIVIITIHEDEKHVCGLAELGVDGYLKKEEPVSEYVKAIRVVTSGGTYFSQRVVPILSGLNSDRSSPHLTTRELEVLELIATGASTREVADQLYITRRTVTTHLSNIYQKLGVSNRVAIVRKARELKLISS